MREKNYRRNLMEKAERFNYFLYLATLVIKVAVINLVWRKHAFSKNMQTQHVARIMESDKGGD